ncbi:MAG: response regulator [Cytophagaceae bacterium]
MRFLNNISIKAKLLLLTLILLVPLLVFIGVNIEQRVDDQRRLNIIEKEISYIERLRYLINVLQDERALSVSFASTEGKLFRAKLLAAQKQTDEEIERMQAYLSQNAAAPTILFSLQQNLNIHRTELASLSFDSVRVDYFYTGLIMQFLKEADKSYNRIPESELKKEIYTLLSIMNTREYLGRIRSLLLKIIATGDFSVKEYGEFSVNKATFDLYLNNFYSEANKDIMSFYSQQMPHENLESVLLIINQFYNSHSLLAVKPDAKQWYEVVSPVMDGFAEISAYTISNSRNKINVQLATARNNLLIYILLLIFLLGTAVFLSFYIIRTIAVSLEKLSHAAGRIANGDVDVEINLPYNDEMGALGQTFQEMVRSINLYAASAETIGKGNYDVAVKVRSEKDKLGNALFKMKSNLRQLSIVERRKSWFLSGDRKLNDIMREERNLEKLPEKIISFLCKFLRAEIGVFYLADDSYLSATGIHAAGQDILNKKFVLNEGYLGEAIKRKQITVLSDLKEDHLVVKTGLIQVQTSSLILVPVYYESNLLGLIELAFADQYKKHVLDFLESVVTKISVVISNLNSEIQTRELLMETQNQAEELEVQQEELRQINEELIIQRNKLQASEEEIRASQEELQEKNAELEEKANQLEEQYEALHLKNKEVEEARELLEKNMRELEQTSKYKSEFLANMSHELRTPLNSVLILAKILSENKDKNLTEKQIEFANVIFNSGNDLLHLINEILDLSKLEAGKVVLEFSEFKVSDLSIEEQFLPLAKDKGLKFSLNIGQDLPSIKTDKFRLMQILKNLVSNAIKFTPEGGEVKINVFDMEPGQIQDFRIRGGGKVVGFSVKDNGIGISKDKLDKIFEAFHQEDASITRKYGGTGLGLSISRELARLLGGAIHVESEIGKGSTFTLLLPVESVREITVPTELKEQKKLPLPVRKNGKSEGKKILIVEDDQNFAKILDEVARANNYSTLKAFTGGEALAIVEKEDFDALILDLNLPDMKGWKIVDKLKEKGKENIPVHVISAEEQYDAPKGLTDYEFSLKPLDKSSLEKVFSELFSRKLVEKVLIIEDNPQQNNAIKELLLTKNIDSDQAYSAGEALEKLKQKSYECIIADLELPDVREYDFLEKLKQEKLNENVPVVIYSGKDIGKKDEEILKKFANTIIIKSPYSYDRLMAEVNLFLHSIKGTTKGNSEEFTYQRPDTLLKGKKVLLVDDDIRNIYALHSVLEQEGMEIITASNGLEALDELKKNTNVDIVLMDIMMPEMDGLEAIRRIRSEDRYKSLPIIAVTAKAMKGDRESSIQAGASDYISKPVDVNKLLSLMRVWLY